MKDRDPRDQTLLDAHNFWNTSGAKHSRFSHLLGSEDWPQKMWDLIGKNHLTIFRLGIEKHGAGGELKRLLEWGPGGGSNVVAFAEVFEHITGVDISLGNLGMAESALRSKPSSCRFSAFPIAIDNPFVARELTTDPFDFLICTAVIQHMPFIDYFYDVFCLWRELLRPDARALIQFRTNHRARSMHRDPDQKYDQNVARRLMFNVPKFVEMCGDAGWDLLELIGDKKPTRSGYVYAWLRNP